MTKETLSIYADDLPTLASGRQVVSRADVTRPEMLARVGSGRFGGLLHILKDCFHSVTKQKIAGVFR